MKSAISIVAACLVLIACSTEDKVSQIAKEAEAYVSANEIGLAEKKLKEGLVKFNGPSRLKQDLIMLYANSKQINKLEEYYLTVDLNDVDIVAVSLGHVAIGNYYVSEAVWPKAATNFIKAGNGLLNCETPLCRNEAALSFTKAGLAFALLHKPEKVREQYEKIQSMLKTKECRSRDSCPEVVKASKQLSEVLAGTFTGD